MPGSTWQIQYGDSSSASGSVGTDVVKIGSTTVQSQAVELAQKLSPQLLSQSTSNGLLGLAFSNLNTVKPRPVQTPLENMITQKDISADEELFTCYLGSYKDAKDPDRGQSFYTFGSIDQSALQASGQELQYTPIDSSRGYWMFNSPSVVINGEQFDLPNNQAVADTGTTLLMVSDAVCEQFYGQIPGAEYSEDDQGWVFPVDTSSDDLPDFSVAVGTYQIVIDKEHFGFAPSVNQAMTFGGIQVCGRSRIQHLWRCLPAKCLRSRSVPCGHHFRSRCSQVFDGGNMRFGVVQRADPTPDGPES